MRLIALIRATALATLLVAGSPQNIKITSGQDLVLAARILEARRSE